MIELRDVSGAINRKGLRINQTTEDRKENWNVDIETGNLPTAFENSSLESRQVTLHIIDGSDWKASEHSNSFLIPLVLTAICRVDDKTLCYYQQRYPTQSTDILHSMISASITLDDGQTDPIENPHLMLEFNVVEQDNSARMQGNDERFRMDMHKGETYVHTDLNENANGGLDIPIDQMNRDLVPGDKVVTV